MDRSVLRTSTSSGGVCSTSAALFCFHPNEADRPHVEQWLTAQRLQVRTIDCCQLPGAQACVPACGMAAPVPASACTIEQACHVCDPALVRNCLSLPAALPLNCAQLTTRIAECNYRHTCAAMSTLLSASEFV